MTQKEIDMLFAITDKISTHKWFKKKNRTINEIQLWVAKQLADYEIYTLLSEKLNDRIIDLSFPTRLNFRNLVSKEEYDEFHNPKEVDNDSAGEN